MMQGTDKKLEQTNTSKPQQQSPKQFESVPKTEEDSTPKTDYLDRLPQGGISLKLSQLKSVIREVPKVRPVEEPVSMSEVVADEKAKIYGNAPPPPDHLD